MARNLAQGIIGLVMAALATWLTNKLVEQGLTFEVQQQLGDGVVRTIAMGSSDGLRRGMSVTDTGDNITPLFIGQLRPPRSWFSLRERALVQAQALQDAADRAPDRLRVIRSRADLADHLARRQAGAQVLGAVLGVGLVSAVVPGRPGYVALGLVVVGLMLPFVLLTPDDPLPLAARPPLGSLLRGMWISPRRHPDFGWAWASRFITQLSGAAASLYLLYFLQDSVKVKDAEGRSFDHGEFEIVVEAAGPHVPDRVPVHG